MRDVLDLFLLSTLWISLLLTKSRTFQMGKLAEQAVEIMVASGPNVGDVEEVRIGDHRGPAFSKPTMRDKPVAADIATP